MAGITEGSYYRLLNNVNQGTLYDTRTYLEECTDVVGQRQSENPFTLNKVEPILPPVLNGNSSSGPGDTSYFVLNNVPLSPNLDHLSVPGLPNNHACAAMVLSRTNPSRPVVDLPILFAELRELPSLFKIAGRTLIRKGAGAFLSYQFGWKPLISDMMNLIDFSAHVRKRSDELRRIFEGGGTKAKVTCGEGTVFERNSNVALWSLDGIQRYIIDKQTQANKWATVRWVPDEAAVGKLPKGRIEMERLARRAVLGLTLDASTAWELIPFSWLVDYFTSIGDYLAAHRNMMPVKHTTPCVMQSTATLTRGFPIPLTTRPSLEAKDFMVKTTRKTRVAQPLTLPAVSFEYLSKTQVSILGSLGITRIPRRLLK